VSTGGRSPVQVSSPIPARSTKRLMAAGSICSRSYSTTNLPGRDIEPQFGGARLLGQRAAQYGHLFGAIHAVNPEFRSQCVSAP